MISLQRYGPWALITGPTQGIGREFAEELASAGFQLVLASRSAERLAELAADLESRYGLAHRVLVVDLTDPAAPQRLDEGTADLDIGLLVSNAGSGRPGALLDRNLADLLATTRVNALAPLELAHRFGRRLVGRGQGGILLVSSMGGLHGLPWMATDSAAKAFTTNIGEALRFELRDTGVDVAVLLPGGVDTPVVDRLGLSREVMPLPLVPARQAAREGLRALELRRARHIPGRLFRIAQRLTPRAVSIRANARMLAAAAARVDARERVASEAVT